MPDLGLLQDLVVLFACGALAVVLSRRARLPPLLGYLLVGVVIGPSGLGIIGAAAIVIADPLSAAQGSIAAATGTPARSS